MGDFNVQYEEYKRDYQRKGSFHWSYNIFHQIKHKFNMKDGIKLYHSITPQNRMNTFHPVQPNKSSTRIDYIWISRSQVMKSLTSGIFTAQYFNTDHKAVHMSFLQNLIFQKTLRPKYDNRRSRKESTHMIP
jgi:hypothetical protein